MSRIPQIQKLLQAEPNDSFLNFSLAMEYAKEGEHEQALDQFERVCQIDPDYVAAYFQRAKMLIDLDRKADARSAFDEGIVAANRVGDQHAVSEMTQARKLIE